jgi:hypothetical protein
MSFVFDRSIVGLNLRHVFDLFMQLLANICAPLAMKSAYYMLQISYMSFQSISI